MKTIKDYLPFYLGCKVETHTRYGIIILSGHLIDEVNKGMFSKIQPLLRPLSSMTEEERQEFIDLCGLEPEDIDCLIMRDDTLGGYPCYGTAHLTNIIQWAVGIKYLISKPRFFDVFELIEKGFALDATKFEKEKIK